MSMIGVMMMMMLCKHETSHEKGENFSHHRRRVFQVIDVLSTGN
jgi:hypothetical protein